MKKQILSSIAILLFVSYGYTMSPDSFKFQAAVTNVKNKVTIIVSPQVELISIVQTISKYPTVLGFLMSQDSSEYKSEVLEHFSPYMNHPLVQMFDRLSLQPGMLNYMAPSSIMLYTDQSLQLRGDIILDDLVIKRAGGRDTLELFLELLRDFAIQSSFDAFYNEHRGFYVDIVENTIQNLGPTDYIGEMENFYGRSQKSYNIVLVPLYNGVGFGNSLICPDDQREIYNVMGPQKVIAGTPFFGDEYYLKNMMRHEFSHPFINPLTDKHWTCIKNDSVLFEFIPDVAKQKVCGGYGLAN